MPDLTSFATTFRAGHFKYRLYLSYLPYTQVLAASVNGTPDYSGGSIQTITVDTITAGSVAACLAGQTVEIRSSAGVHKGYTRVAEGGGSGAVVQIAELSPGTINIADNDLVRVYQDYRIWDKLVSATAALNKDSRLAYSDQGANLNPSCNSGGPVVGFVSGSDLTANFYGSTSRTFDPDSGGTVTHSWTFPGATPNTSTDADPTAIAFPAGDAVFATHVTTDASNSKTSTQYIPVWAHSADYPPIELSACRMFYNEQDGWSAEFQVAQDSMAAASLMPDGCLAVIWYQAYYSGTEAAYGSNVTGRSHVRFVGYLDRAQTRLTPEQSETTFTALSPLGVLAKTPALPQITIHKTSPTKWRHLKTNTVHRTLFYLWLWHNSAFNAHDFILPGSGDLQYKRFAAGVTSSQLEQYRDAAGSLNLLVTCDRIGRLITGFDPQLLDSTARSGRTTLYNYALSDLLEADWEEPYHWQSKTVVGEGITDGLTTTANKPVFSRAPGSAPASRGLTVETLDRQIVDDQADLNERTGLQFAKTNGLYNGRVVPRGMRLRLPDGYGFVDPAYQEYATFTIPATTNARGTAFTTATKWLFRSVDETYNPDGGALDVNATVDHETFGPDGATEIRRQASENDLPSFTIPDITFPGFDLPPVATDQLGASPNIAAFNTNGYLYLTADFATSEIAGGPTWTRIALNTLAPDAVSGTVESFTVYAFSPKYMGTGTGVNGWLVTTTGIYLIEDIGGTPTSTLQHTFASTAGLGHRFIDSSFGFPGWVAVASIYPTAGPPDPSTVTYTTDGTNWTEVTITTNDQLGTTVPENVWPGLHISSKVAGLMYAVGYPSSVGRLYRSTDYGATWSAASPVINLSAGGAAPQGYATIHPPFNDNPGDSFVFASGWVNGTASLGGKRFFTATVGSTGATDMNISTSRAPSVFQRSFSSLGANRRRCAFLSYENAGTKTFDLWVTTTGGGTAADWTRNNIVNHYTSLSLTGHETSEQMYLWGLSGAMGFSADFGVTVDNRQGNLASLGTPGLFVNICGV